jgi:hypothetical protein
LEDDQSAWWKKRERLTENTFANPHINWKPKPEN